MIQTKEAVSEAKKLFNRTGTRDPYRLARELNITIFEQDFKKQKGAYRYYERNGYIFINKNLEPVMKKIVLFHEIAHHVLHRKEAKVAGILKEFNLFDMKNNEMEYEANLFAAEMMLPDDQVLPYIYQGYDVAQIARATYSDINLVALKVSELNRRGYHFREQNHDAKFLR